MLSEYTIASLPLTRDPVYLTFIRTLPCCLCGETAEPHHVYGGATGAKCSDYLTIPLSRLCHKEVTDIGRVAFEKKHSMDFMAVIIACLCRYLAQQVKIKIDWGKGKVGGLIP